MKKGNRFDGGRQPKRATEEAKQMLGPPCAPCFKCTETAQTVQKLCWGLL